MTPTPMTEKEWWDYHLSGVTDGDGKFCEAVFKEHIPILLAQSRLRAREERDGEIREAVLAIEIEKAHTYSSENADIYRAHDAGQKQMKSRILSLLTPKE